MKVIISISNFLLFFLILESSFPTSVKAQCVQGDVSVQYSMNGSQKPSQRTNDVSMESNANCRGNASVSTGVQGHIGSESTEQNRRINHVQQGSNKYPQVPNSRTVQIRSNVQVDADNPAERFPHRPQQ